jgi:hypothetical protein
MTLAHDMVDAYPRNLAPLPLGLFVACATRAQTARRRARRAPMHACRAGARSSDPLLEVGP